MSADFQLIGEAAIGICALSSNVGAPRYGPLYIAIRSDRRINATATVLLRIDTVEAVSHEVRAVVSFVSACVGR